MKTCPQHGDRWIIPDTGRCSKCQQFNETRPGKGRRLPLADKALKHDYDAGYNLTRRPDGTFTEQAMLDFKKRLFKDDVRMAELETSMRRPAGVSKERFGVAVRAASREPMLNSNPDVIRLGLDHRNVDASLRKRRVAKGSIAGRPIIKPLTLHNAKYGRNSPFWGEREWIVFTLKYGHGYIVHTDIGDDSSVFPTWGELQSAIRKSGWEIVR